MKKIHYSWVICLSCTLLIFISMGVVSNGFATYLPYIMDEYSLTHTQTSLILTIRCFVSVLSMLFIGKYYKVFSLRLGATLSAVFAGIAFLMYSFATDFTSFSIASGISGLSYGLGSMVPVSLLINNWFCEHKAVALGICSAGSGIGAIVLPPIITGLLIKVPMNNLFRWEALFVIFCAIIIFLLLRNDPKEKGVVRLGENAEPAKAKIPSLNKENRPDITTNIWIFLMIMTFINGGTSSPGISHLTVLFDGEGYSSIFVATLFSMVGITLTFGKVLFGQVTDKVGGYKSCIIFGIVLILGNAFCSLAGLNSHAICIIAAFVIGLGYALPTLSPTVCANDMANNREYEKFIKNLQVSYQAGTLVFQSLPGIMADHFGGSYVPTYRLFAILQVISTVLLILAYKASRKNIENHDKQ